MRSVMAAIQQLSYFSDNEKVSPLLQELVSLVKSQDVAAVAFDSLRAQFDQLLEDEDTQVSRNHVTLANAVDQALRALSELAGMHDKTVMITAAEAYEQGKQLVESSEASFAEGEAQLKRAAELGHAGAAFLLAEIYFDGFASEHTIRIGGPVWGGQKQDFPLGLKYLEFARLRGHQEARFKYAGFLFIGKEGLNITPDKDKALVILDELCEENYLPAIKAKIEILGESEPLEEYDEVSEDDDVLLASENPSSAVEPQDFLQRLEEKSKSGSLLATERLIRIYTQSVSSLIEPDEQKVKFYEQRFIDLQPESGKMILSLMGRASSLGDCETTYELAKFYFSGKSKGMFVSPNAKKAINYLHLSLSQGEARAALDLADIYLGLNYISIANNYRFWGQLRDFKNVEKAVDVLKQGASCEEGTYNRSMCALRLAELYRSHPAVISNVGERRDAILHYYERAVSDRNYHAVAKLVALYLVGDADLSLAPNVERADELLSSTTLSDCLYDNAYEMSRMNFEATSKTLMSRFLFCIFRSIALGEKNISRPIKVLLPYLKNSSAKHDRLLLLSSEELVKKWEDFCKRNPAKFDFESRSDDRQKMLQSPEYQELVRETYTCFDLECPLSFSPDDSNVASFTLGKVPNALALTVSRDMLENNRYLKLRFGNGGSVKVYPDGENITAADDSHVAPGTSRVYGNN